MNRRADQHRQRGETRPEQEMFVGFHNQARMLIGIRLFKTFKSFKPFKSSETHPPPRSRGRTKEGA
jgi:hypothetical protein